MSKNKVPIQLQGGVNEVDPRLSLPPGSLDNALNIECKENARGYRRIKGYQKFDSSVVPGEGDVLGVWYYNDKCYAIRNAVGGVTASMYESSGGGWTAKKTGLSPNGSYEFYDYYFESELRMFGVSGVHNAFEWDGTTWTDILTGFSPSDTPEHLVARKGRLWMSKGEEAAWSDVAAGANEYRNFTGWQGTNGGLALKSQITGFQIVPGGDLLITARNQHAYISATGTAAVPFAPTDMNEQGIETGAIAKTIQRIGPLTIAFDDRGVISITDTDTYGNFNDATLSYALRDTLELKKDQVTTSCIVRSKSQYRLFFSDGSGLIFSFARNELIGITPIEFTDPVKCVVSKEDSNGDEIILFGSTDGFIYQMEQGNSFDGENIRSFARVAYTNLGVNYDKFLHKVVLEFSTSGVVNLQIKVNCIDSEGRILETDWVDVVIANGNALGPGAILGQTLLGPGNPAPNHVMIDGVGEYFLMTFLAEANDEEPWEINQIIWEISQ